jgi:hypothetical protein
MNFITFEKCIIFMLFINIIYGSEFCTTDNCDEVKQKKDRETEKQKDNEVKQQIDIDLKQQIDIDSKLQKDIEVKQQKDKKTERQINIDCNKLVMRMRKKEHLKLTGFDDEEENEVLKSEKKKMFFVESSGRSYLTARQACAVESAIRNSGLNVFVVAMTSKGNYDLLMCIFDFCVC